MQHRISYQDYQIAAYSQGEGETIIFLHGWPTNAELWRSQVEALQANYRVIAFDWLGFGASDKPTQHTYTFTAQKEILDTVISELVPPDEKITLVGHDIGGPPTILWASENPERVARLILLNTILYTLKTPLDAFSEVLLSLPITRDLFVSNWGLNSVFGVNTKSGSAATKAHIKELVAAYANAPAALKRQTLVQPMHHGRQNELKTLSQQFAQLPVDKHLIIAKKDPLCYAHIRRLSEENPDVPVHYLDNCGHFMPIDRAEELNGVLRGILVGG
ncbi:MAG: alpha/beta hydrolase [Bacteroidota bacterium]